MPTPRMLMNVERLYVLMATLGATVWMSMMLSTPPAARSSALSTVAEAGTSWRLTSRRSAVTTTSSSSVDAGGALDWAKDTESGMAAISVATSADGGAEAHR